MAAVLGDDSYCQRYVSTNTVAVMRTTLEAAKTSNPELAKNIEQSNAVLNPCSLSSLEEIGDASIQPKMHQEPAATNMHTNMGQPIDKILSSIKSLDELTLQILESIEGRCGEGVELPLKISRDEFTRWCDEVGDYGRVYAEFYADLQRVILKDAPSELHQGVEQAMCTWLQDVGSQLSTQTTTYLGRRQSGVSLSGSENGTKKIVDACLAIRERGEFPLVVVEVGFTEPLSKLFEDAERLFRGSYRKIKLVVLVKIYETNRHSRNEFPWGLQQNTLDALQNLDQAGQLGIAIEQWYQNQGLRIIGDLKIEMYWYSCNRSTKPTIPLYTFTYNGGTLQTGKFAHRLRTGEDIFLDKDYRLLLHDRHFELPVQTLEDSIQESVDLEKGKRIRDMISEAHV